MKLGIVDLDTSHPAAWIPIERELGHEVIGVWDGGSVHPKGFAEKFAGEHKIPQVYPSLAAMASDVDCAIIHGCDWDTHVEKARPFVEANKAVLIDKPIAGNLRDLGQIEKWAGQGARITGGSSLRFCVEVRDWLAKPVVERGQVHTVLCGCGIDEFNYGVHAYSMLCGILGPGIRSVRHLGHHVQRRIQINWTDGRIGILTSGKGAWVPFFATAVTDKAAAHLVADTKHLYRSLLEATLPYLDGKSPVPPVPMTSLIEAELAALAARQSYLNDDREILLIDLADDRGFDGVAFAAEYRKAKYPM